MTDHETEFNQWKEETRREALEKEVERLRESTEQQSRSLRNLRRTLLWVILAAITSLAGLWVFSMDGNYPDGIYSAQEKDSTSLETITETSREKTTPVTKEDSTPPEKAEIITPASDTVAFFIPDDGIFFSVQIGAYLGVDLEKFRNNMVSLHQNSAAGINQFTLGIFPTYNEASEFNKVIRKIGFEEAHIIATQDGHRIKVSDALNMRADSIPGRLSGN
ncbi:MAG: hypothetical protein R6U46_05830 [Marinilabilia sp.]